MARSAASTMPDPGVPWHPERVKAELRIRSGSLAALAGRWGVSRAHVALVVRQPGASIRIEQLIAAELGMTPYAIWPDRWNAADEPLPRAELLKTGASRLPRHPQKREAA